MRINEAGEMRDLNIRIGEELKKHPEKRIFWFIYEGRKIWVKQTESVRNERWLRFARCACLVLGLGILQPGVNPTGKRRCILRRDVWIGWRGAVSGCRKYMPPGTAGWRLPTAAHGYRNSWGERMCRSHRRKRCCLPARKIWRVCMLWDCIMGGLRSRI